MGQPTDHDLWAQARRGDSTAFGEIYRRHVRDVQAFAAWRSVDPSYAEDVTSAVFMEAWRRRERLELDPALTSARPLLIGIAVNVIRDFARKRRRHAAALSRIAEAGDLPGHEERSVERIDAANRVRELRAKLKCLPSGELDVIAVVAWET